jgi:hypothetical protein
LVMTVSAEKNGPQTFCSDFAQNTFIHRRGVSLQLH